MFRTTDTDETQDQAELPTTLEDREAKTGSYGSGGNMTLEILGVLLALVFLARVLGDIIRRIRNGRSLDDGGVMTSLGSLTHKILDSLNTVERALRTGKYASDSQRR